MSEQCPECRGEGDVWDDRDGRYRYCMNCGGEGRIDPYEQDEWYDDGDYDDVDEWEDYCEEYPEDCLDDEGHFTGVPSPELNPDESTAASQSLPMPHPVEDSAHDHQ